MKKLFGSFAALVLTAAFASPASAQFAKPKDAIKYREAAMTLMASHFGRMGPVAKKEAPFDAAKIRENMAVLNVLAALPWTAFGEGTQGGESKDAVWSDPQGFKKAEDEFHGAMKQLNKAVDAGDFDAFRVAFGTVGKSCKSCHDSYRKEKK